MSLLVSLAIPWATAGPVRDLDELSVVVADGQVVVGTRSDTVVRATCDATPELDGLWPRTAPAKHPPDQEWTVEVDAAPDGTAGALRVVWRFEETPWLPPCDPGGPASVVARWSDDGSFVLDAKRCVSSPNGSDDRVSDRAPHPGYVLAAEHDGTVAGVKEAGETIDPQGRVFPAYRWVEVTAAGERTVPLDAGYRTRVIASADGGQFATVYAQPEEERPITWSLYDLVSGERRGVLVPPPGASAFLVPGERVLFATSKGELTAYELATGRALWRVEP